MCLAHSHKQTAIVLCFQETAPHPLLSLCFPNSCEPLLSFRTERTWSSNIQSHHISLRLMSILCRQHTQFVRHWVLPSLQLWTLLDRLSDAILTCEEKMWVLYLLTSHIILITLSTSYHCNRDHRALDFDAVYDTQRSSLCSILIIRCQIEDKCEWRSCSLIAVTCLLPRIFQFSCLFFDVPGTFAAFIDQKRLLKRSC